MQATRRPEWEDVWEPPARGSYGWGAEDLEPRWTADRPLAERITRVGIFRTIDPAEEGGLWPKPKWWALAGYLGVMGWAFSRAWRITGGPVGWTEHADRRR